MSVLTLKTLICIKKQDVFKDTIRVSVEGKKVAGDFKMGKNDAVTLNTNVNFTGTADIVLTEIDPNSAPDVLGTVVAQAANPGAHNGVFQALPGADYLLTYEVSL